MSLHEKHVATPILLAAMLFGLCSPKTAHADPSTPTRATETDSPPEDLRVRSYRGGPIPTGMHVEQKSNPWLIAGGAAGFAASYGLTLRAAYSAKLGTTTNLPFPELLVPVVGPVIMTGRLVVGAAAWGVIGSFV
jgi:hypothetical protein